MRKQRHRNRPAPWAILVLAVALASCGPGLATQAATLVLKDGRTLTGRYVEMAGVAESPLAPKIQAGEVATSPIIMVDDGLRRTFIHRSQVVRLIPDDTNRNVRINLWQHVADRGGGVGRVGPAIRVTPFDEYGRRIYELNTPDGVLSVVQGITQITPVYTKVEGLVGEGRSIVWDMRIATSSIPRDILSRILATAVPRDDPDARLQVVRLYLQNERYRDAVDELEHIVKDFPDRKEQLAEQTRPLRQLGARLLLQEIQLRASAGQHQFARLYLSQFPSEGVGGELLQQVRELSVRYAEDDKRRQDLIAGLRGQIAKIGDENGRRRAEQIADEIARDVNGDAIGRLASYERLADDAAMSPDGRVALAISGWLVGAGQATDNFQVAVSLAEVRDMVRQYLRDPVAGNRAQIFAELHDREGATVERVAQILKLMKPPLDVPVDAQRGPRCYEVKVPGLTGQADTRYLIQLPPEYDPLRRYPVVVALADAGVTPAQMLDFWAGPADQASGERLGQATRHGYIVLAVDWQQPHQLAYEYSAREHHAVLSSLRDANRRFAIDTDRVFLTGHGMGGDAVWDIALAHPDLWVGAIPIVSRADRYCIRYKPNGEYLAWYVVAGELDGDKMVHNAKVTLDHFMMRPKFDATVVEYLGRGYEPLGDEIQRLFDWMNRRRRTMPKEFEYLTMRPWDNFFQWVEVQGIPERSLVMPLTWTLTGRARPFMFTSRLMEGGKLIVTARSEDVTVWLSPELVKFEEPLVVELNTRSMSRERFVRPDLNVLLEDARTRGDRQHPFWAKLTKSKQ